MAGSSILALLSVCTLALGQTPVDETNGESTIKVVKKRRKEPAPPPATSQTPKIERAMTPPPPRTTPPPPPAPKVDPLPRAPAPKAEPRRERLVPSQKIETNAGSTKVLPWVTLGISAVAIAVGSVFAVKTVNTLDDTELELELKTNKKGNTVEIPEEFRDRQKSVFLNSLGATVLISAGVSGGIASVVALSSD